MNYEDLDSDTKGIIEAMCHNTGKSKEMAILGLVELGMLSMKAAVSSNHPFNNVRKKVMKKIFATVNSDPKLIETAKAYDAYWELSD